MRRKWPPLLRRGGEAVAGGKGIRNGTGWRKVYPVALEGMGFDIFLNTRIWKIS